MKILNAIVNNSPWTKSKNLLFMNALQQYHAMIVLSASISKGSVTQYKGIIESFAFKPLKRFL